MAKTRRSGGAPRQDPALTGKAGARRPSAAMPYGDVPAFMAKLRGMDGVAARALEFTILTVARVGEVRGATWSEIDPGNMIWTIPAERMKGAGNTACH